jgi:hypothetical protein
MNAMLPLPPEKRAEGLAMLSLASYVRGCWAEAKSAKSTINTRLLRCDRQRKGEYDPEVQATLPSGSTLIYMMITDIKCRAAESWITDVLMSADRTFSIAPTAEPDLPEQLKAEVIQTVAMEVMQIGGPVLPEAVMARAEMLYNEVNEEISERAASAAKRMESRIQDSLDESGFADQQTDLVHDFVTYPTVVMAGPLHHRKRVMQWGPDWVPQIKMKNVLDYERVSPYDIFPSPQSTGPDDGYLIRRHRMQRKDLQSFIGHPGYNDSQIKLALDHLGRTGLREWDAADSEKDHIDDKNLVFNATTIDAIEFWGSCSGSDLRDWGMKGVDPYTDYEANVWLVGPYAIRAAINSDPLGRRPFSTASFRKVPGSFWGQALPESMRDVQIMCNAAARALAMNMGIASGPQVEVTTDRLTPGQVLTEMHPWKIWQTTSDRTGGGQPGIRFFQPNMNAEALLGVYQYFQKVADEVTGVPNYLYGSSAVSGAGRTASGLSMLMENAAKGIKHAILNLDSAKARMIKQAFEYFMRYDPDPSIKGDMQIVPVGVVATLIKESVQEKRQAFLAATANPIDFQIMGPAGRASVLHQVAGTLDMDADDIVPDPEVIRAQMRQQMQQAQQQPPQQALPAPPQRIVPQRAEDGSVTSYEVQ